MERRSHRAAERAAPFELEQRRRDLAQEPDRDAAGPLQARLEHRPAAGTEMIALDRATNAGRRQGQIERPLDRRLEAYCHHVVIMAKGAWLARICHFAVAAVVRTCGLAQSCREARDL
jgi:hypothetical protein